MLISCPGLYSFKDSNSSIFLSSPLDSIRLNPCFSRNKRYSDIFMFWGISAADVIITLFLRQSGKIINYIVNTVFLDFFPWYRWICPADSGKEKSQIIIYFRRCSNRGTWIREFTFCSIAIAGGMPLIEINLGLFIRPRNWRAYDESSQHIFFVLQHK